MLSSIIPLFMIKEGDKFEKKAYEEGYDIKRIKKKYGETFNEISKFLSDAIVEKDKLENFNDIYKNLLLEKDKLKKIKINGTEIQQGNFDFELKKTCI